MLRNKKRKVVQTVMMSISTTRKKKNSGWMIPIECQLMNSNQLQLIAKRSRLQIRQQRGHLRVEQVVLKVVLRSKI